MESDSDMAQRLQNEENTRGDSRTRRIPTRVQQMVSGILTILLPTQNIFNILNIFTF